MQRYNLNAGFIIRLVLVMIIALGFLACDFIPLPGKSKRVKFLDDSFSVEMPASWSIRKDLNDAADLQMGNLFKEAYTIILSEHKSDFDEITLEDHSDLTRSLIRAIELHQLVGQPFI